MKKQTFYLFLVTIALLFLSISNAHTKEDLVFSFHKLASGVPGKTLLVVGGIQGDEPGGFNAAALLVTSYKIKKGSVWVVPNLNFVSIVKRKRGVHGDLNRKFEYVPPNDPQYDVVQKIKGIILNKHVDMVLNLHDGSGFYNPKYINKLHNPKRWGQCVIIDQKRIKTLEFGNLEEVAQKVVNDVNQNLIAKEEDFHVMNTKTAEGNVEMAKTLSYFAIRHLKPAFGVEVSKTFLTHKRAYYHLNAVESFMNNLGIEFEREFTLSARGVKNAINNDIKLGFFNNKIVLNVKDARRWISFVPLKKSSEIDFESVNPLIAVVKSVGSTYKIFYGNRRLTRIHPSYWDYDFSVNSVALQVDNILQKVRFGQTVNVKRSFKVIPDNTLRVNVIGFRKPKNKRDDSGVLITKRNILTRYSIDRKGKTYRVEVYKDRKFAGMALVNFK